MRRATCALPFAVALCLVLGCSLPRGQRWRPDAAEQPDGGAGILCGGDDLSDDYECAQRDERQIYRWCEIYGEFFRVRERDCTSEGLLCVSQPPYDSCTGLEPVDGAGPIGCTLCRPCALECVRNSVARCLPDGSGWEVVEICDTGRGEICDQGRCGNGCELARLYASNVGCEYYAVDLDNAVVDSGSAAAQQFAVVVSNPSPVEARIRVERCRRQPCESEPNVETVLVGGLEEVIVNPDDLETLLLDPAEVDGSPPGVFDQGTHSALSPRAYRITSTAPVVVYQFNPYDNSVNVFSNDASLLVPVTALAGRYTVLSWPQTIAFSPADPSINMEIDLRATLSIVGTEPGTRVRVRLSTDIVPSGEAGDPIPRRHAGETLEATIGPFDVLNLETGYYGGRSSFLADFTGSVIESSAPVAVFAGSEASDVPIFETLADRFCCADHLEEQLPPDRALGFSFVVPHTPSRTRAVASAGGSVTPIAHELEWYRVLAVRDDTQIETTLAGFEQIVLQEGEDAILEARGPFTLESNAPVAVGLFVGSQWTTGMTGSDLPGGDPAFILVPPIEQWRRSYVFLVPDKYAFDYVIVMIPAPLVGRVTFDGQAIATRAGCNRERADGLPADDPSSPEHWVVTCALSQPIIHEGLPRPDNVEHGLQQDGVHEVRLTGQGSLEGIGLVVYGFDSYVSYGYPGGTDLRSLQ